MGERLEDLRRGLDGAPVVERAAAQGISQRAARDEGIGDVDVALVTGERECAQAPGVAEARRGLDFALGPGAGLALARDDLQCDLAVGLFVAGEPH